LYAEDSEEEEEERHGRLVGVLMSHVAIAIELESSDSEEEELEELREIFRETGTEGQLSPPSKNWDHTMSGELTE
jgi:hypothetical protein